MNINDEILWHPQLTSTTFLIYCKIKSLLDGDSQGALQVTQLSSNAGALSNPIRQLKQLGLIDVIKRPGTTNIYRLLK